MNFLKRGLLISLSTAMVAVLLLLLRASPARAGNCAQDNFTAAGNSQTLGCTAGDVSITGASNPTDLNGNTVTTCVAGESLNFLVDFTVVSTSDKTRSNVGLYLGTIPVGQAGSSALSGTCDDNIMAQRHNRLAPFATPCTAGSACLGDKNYTELDGNPAADNCGDADMKSTHIVTVELDNVICPSVGSTAVVLPDCTTWQVPGKTITCFSDPTQGWPFVPTAAIPGTTSKCNCGTVSIPITPINPTISATKSVTPASIVEPGGAFHYTAVVKNTTAGAVNVTINQLCDDKFGNIATAATTPPQPACPAGTLGSAANIVCPLPATLAQNASVTCTFDGTVNGTEPLSVTDTVTAHGVGSGAALTAQASITAKISEAAAQAQVSKRLDGGQECAIARYRVEVDNISPASTDETETLSALNDSAFGNLTVLGTGPTPKVVGTTCGVVNGLGTLAGTGNGAGALGTIPVGGNYTCEFDGEFCAKLGNAGACTTGLENVDTVTATLTKEDGLCSGGTNPGTLCISSADCLGGGTCPLTLTPTASLTVDSCFTHNP